MIDSGKLREIADDVLRHRSVTGVAHREIAEALLLALPLIDRMEDVFAAESPGLMTLRLTCLKMEVAEFRKTFPRDEGAAK